MCCGPVRSSERCYGEVLSRVEAVGTVLVHGVSVIKIVFSRAMSPLVHGFVARFSVTQVARLVSLCCLLFLPFVGPVSANFSCLRVPSSVCPRCELPRDLPPSFVLGFSRKVISGPMYLSCH